MDNINGIQKEEIQTKVEEAIFEFTVGDNASAKAKLEAVVNAYPNCFEGWLALAEIACSENSFKEALTFVEKAYALQPEDIHINTSLSRIWMQLGDKSKAEHFGAQARMLSWKDQLKISPEADLDITNS